MVVITCNIKADSGPTQYLEDVSLSWWDLQKEGQYTDVVLVSGQLQVRVHREILLRVSSFLHDLVPPSCSCETPAITLPKVQGDTLKALVELAYTGRSKVESRKGKEEFEGLTELLQIGLEIQCEEIVPQVAPNDVIAADLVKINREKADAVERKNVEEKASPTARMKNEEKAAVERKKPEEIADDEGNKYEDDNTAAQRRENEERAGEYKRKKNEEKTAVSKKRIDDGKYVSEVKADAKSRKSEENSTQIKYFAAEKENDEKKTAVEKASPVKVGRSLRQTRARGRKSTDQVTRAIPFLSPISPRRKDKSPDSIYAKTTRNQKRKIHNILNGSDGINVMPEPKQKKARLVIQPTNKSCKFVNIQDINSDSIADIDLFGENENNNDLVQDPIKVNAAYDSYKEAYFHNSIENPFDGWDKETANNIKEAMFVCPFCQKEFQTKSKHDHHVSWNHFQVEITDKFPGLECAVCTKRFVKKSNYVHHLGSFHKVIDGLMARAFDSKMAQIREEEQGKPFPTPRPYRKDDSRMKTPKRMNIGTPKQNIGTPNQNFGTPKYSAGIPKQNVGTSKQNNENRSTSKTEESEERQGARGKQGHV